MKQIIIPFGHFLFCLLALFPLTQAAGQGFELVFEKGSTVPNIGEPGYDIIESSDGNLLVLTNENGTDGQVLKKLDPNGNLIWQRAVGSAPTTFSVGLLESANGNIVVFGDRRVQGQPTQRALSWQVYSASGTSLYFRTYHDGASHFTCTGAALTSNGQLVMAGFKNFASAAPEMTVVGASTTGAIFWTTSWPSNYKPTKGNVALITNGPIAVAYHDPATDHVAIRTLLLGGNMVAQQVYPQITGGITDLEAGVGSGLFLGLQSPTQDECIFKFDNNLALLWSVLPQGTFGQLLGAVLAATSDGGCGATGYTGGQFLQLFKITAAGAQEWAVIWDNNNFIPGGDGAAIASTSNNGFAFTGQLFSNNNFVIATDAIGQVPNHAVSGRIVIDYNGNCQLDSEDFAYAMKVTLSGSPGVYNDQTTSNGLFNFTVETGTYDLVIDAGQGFQLCQAISVDASQPFGTTNLGDVLVSPDAYYTISGTVFQNSNGAGGCVFNAGEQPVPGRPIHLSISPNGYFQAATDANGQYSFTVPSGVYFSVSTDSIDLCQSCSAIAGTATQDIIRDIGLSCFGGLEGLVFNDENQNCAFDPGEQPLVGWQVAAVLQNTTDTTFMVTNSSGNYFRVVVPGVYEVFAIAPNNLWTSCLGPVLVSTGTAPTPIQQDFPIQAQVICPRLRVDVGTNLLRPCMQSTYTVKYCNDGTDAAQSAYVEVALDPQLSLIASQLPATDLGNNTYRFDIGDVQLGACGEFWFKAKLACSVTPGATHCVEAHIFPDSICAPTNPLWDGSNIELQATCENGEARFTIANTGQGSMAAPINYLVIEDNVLLRPDEEMLFQLAAGADTTVVFPSTGGTLRLETQQAPGHPTSTLTAAWVEGCGATGSEPIEISYITQYPLGDEEDYLAIDCRQNVFSYDPNDKLAFPQGVGNQHFIQKTTELDYQIRFQNTGTAPAFEVVLRDTLSPFLDPETLRPGASSHPYGFALEYGNVAVFTFPNINLPPQAADEEASQGWVKFRIAQTPDNQPATVIENKAAIYFDQNPPIITPLVVHRIPFPETTVNELVTLCNGEVWQGQVFESDTTLTETIHYAFFDSIFITTVAVLPSANSSINETLCYGGSLTVGGTVFDGANPTGEVIFPEGSQFGCDSTVHVMLGFYLPAVANLVGPICPDESINVFDSVFDINNPAGVVVISGVSAGGCDSVVNVNLTFLENSFSEIDTTLSQGGLWGEVPIHSDTTLAMVLPAANGCDSVVTVHISVMIDGVGQPANFISNLNIQPNPASSEAWASFDLPAEAELTWRLTNSLGQIVRTAPAKTKWPAGRHRLPLRLDGMPSGTYHFWLIGPSGSVAARAMVIN